MHPLFADLAREAAELRAEQDLLSRAAARVAAARNGADEVARWLAVGGIASGIGKVYSGCERILRMIAAEIDGHVPQAADWHVTLLKRMAAPLPGVRPAVLNPGTHALLDTLRAFRHRERNAYTMTMRLDRLLELVELAEQGVTGLAADLKTFERTLDRD